MTHEGFRELIQALANSIYESASDNVVGGRSRELLDRVDSARDELLAEFDRLKLCEATLLSLMQSMAPAPTYTPPTIDFGFRSPLSSDIVRFGNRGTGIAGIGGEG